MTDDPDSAAPNGATTSSRRGRTRQPLPDGRHFALARFVRAQMDAKRLTPATVAARSGRRDDGEPVVGRTAMYRYVNQPITRRMQPDIQAGLARGLGVPVKVIEEKVRESLFGIPEESPSSEEEMLFAEISLLPPRDKEMIRGALRLMIDGCYFDPSALDDDADEPDRR